MPIFADDHDRGEFRVSVHVACGARIRTDQRDGETVADMERRHDEAEAVHRCASDDRATGEPDGPSQPSV